MLLFKSEGGGRLEKRIRSPCYLPINSVKFNKYSIVLKILKITYCLKNIFSLLRFSTIFNVFIV